MKFSTTRLSCNLLLLYFVKYFRILDSDSVFVINEEMINIRYSLWPPFETQNLSNRIFKSFLYSAGKNDKRYD